LSQIAFVQRVKIFQRASEKKSSVFVSFRTPEMAQKAVHFLNVNPLVFKDMTQPLEVEYPTQDISKHPPIFANAPPAGLSKKARKQLAAENRIAYIRSAEPMDPQDYEEQLSIHGSVKVYPVKTVPPCTAFAVFDTPKACSEALQQKTMGCNLPRHKRVDFVLDGISEHDVLHFVHSIADVKQTNLENNILTVEFLTALGSAKAIVKTKTDKIGGKYIQADYSPSIKPESENNDSNVGDMEQEEEQPEERITIATVSVPTQENQDTTENAAFSEDLCEQVANMQVTL
jgi:hypothetical protein